MTISNLQFRTDARGEEVHEALSAAELHSIDAYWRAAIYLSIGQIYLYDNPLLRTALGSEHGKPRHL